MKKTILLLLVCIIGKTVLCQNADCKVMIDSLKGTYAGACENGKANGQGKATGTDAYEGWFASGYPEGKGMYTWKDGHYYIGQFKKGKLNGNGEMYFESASGNDSIITGFWDKDKYKGLYEKPYIIHNNTTRILDISCKQLNKKGDIITIEGHQVSSEGTTYRRGGPLPYVKNITVINGTYSDTRSVDLANIASIILLNAVFPFRAIIYFTNGEFFEISLLEKSEYEISVKCIN